MCGPALYVMAAGAGMTAVGAYNSARANQVALEGQANDADRNATISDWQASEAMRTGQQQEQNVLAQYGKAKSTQRATMAANGVDISEGSPVDVLATTDFYRDVDAQTVRANTIKSAWGYSTQATQYRDQATNLRNGAGAINPLTSATTSLIGSATSIAGSYFMRKGPAETPQKTMYGSRGTFTTSDFQNPSGY